MRKSRFLIVAAFAAGIFIGGLIGPRSALAQFIQWNRDEVVPIVTVEWSVAGYIAKGTSAVQGTWPRAKVMPLVLVKSNNLGGFVPADGGNQIGNTWQRDEVRPFILLKPNMYGGFVPAN